MSIINEDKLSSKERTDFGLPDKKKYPMPDEEHVRAAIRFFNHCDPEDEKELAGNIKKYMKKYNMKNVNVGDNNRFKKYYNEDTDMGDDNMSNNNVILEYVQPKPINPEVKDIELLPRKEREDLELLEKEIVEFLNSRNKQRR